MVALPLDSKGQQGCEAAPASYLSPFYELQQIATAFELVDLFTPPPSPSTMSDNVVQLALKCLQLEGSVDLSKQQQARIGAAARLEVAYLLRDALTRAKENGADKLSVNNLVGAANTYGQLKDDSFNAYWKVLHTTVFSTMTTKEFATVLENVDAD